ncbi:hypothetical protein ACFSJU_14005 [Paradesertivirga mongoliensis]|uniref:Uncharacterized protein n=1 Tax=Paradesertivirga mongoliensis TaxID=2100740 RepID=A0ABW4ZND9_9SPHI|nr:hypothetical protein [Pedobacter mongoliensis]
MKKDKQKKSKKLNQDSLREELIQRINQSVETLGFNSKKLRAEVEQAAKRIAKQIAKTAKKKREGLHEIVKAGTESRKQPHEFELHDTETFADETSKSDSPSFAVINERENYSNIKRAVKSSNRNANISPVASAHGKAVDKVESEETDLDSQIGSVS